MLHGVKGPEFERALTEYTQAFLTKEASSYGRGMRFGDVDGELDPELLEAVVANVKVRLAEHVHVLHEYSDDALGLKELMRERMALMTPSEFERVLHPIFEQDELTLIISGAVLGAAAGFIQQVYTVATASDDDGASASSSSAEAADAKTNGGDANGSAKDLGTDLEDEDWETTLVSRARAEADAAMAAARAAAARRREERAALAEVERTMKRWPTRNSRDAGRLVWSRNVDPNGKPPPDAVGGR
jgi:hypothetical protein